MLTGLSGYDERPCAVCAQNLGGDEKKGMFGGMSPALWIVVGLALMAAGYAATKE